MSESLYSPCKNYYIKYTKECKLVDIFNNKDEFLFRLDHNTYQSHYCCTIIEFVYNKDNELRILINNEHSVLSIYDMEGKLCHIIGSCDEFYTRKFRVTEDNKEYLVLYGFIWTPINFISIYDLDELINNKDYQPDNYWEQDTDDLRLNLNCNDFIDNKVCFGMTPSNFKEFMVDKKKKEEIAKKELLNIRWNEENILKVILIKTRSSLELIDQNQAPSITCVGGNSGYDFPFHAENIILKKINYKNPNKIIIDLIARLVFSDNYEMFSLNGTDLKEVNLIFTINNSFTMQIIIPMVFLPYKERNWFPEDDKDVIIKFNKCS
jgi:hypothetical protein